MPDTIVHHPPTADIPWKELLLRFMTWHDVGTLDQLLYAAHDCGRVCGHKAVGQ